MDAGKLDKRLIIKTVNKSDDGFGGFTDSVSTNKTIWANVQEKSGEIKSDDGKRSWVSQIEIICRKKAFESINNRTSILQVVGNVTNYRINQVYNEDFKYFTKIIATRII